MPTPLAHFIDFADSEGYAGEWLEYLIPVNREVWTRTAASGTGCTAADGFPSATSPGRYDHDQRSSMRFLPVNIDRTPGPAATAAS